MFNVPAEIQKLAAQGALFAISHSGGKDSQAMFALVSRVVPADQILVIHAVLEGVTWGGGVEHITDTIGGAALVLARPASTFLDMVDRRRMFPSPKNRQCTSDLKRGPIEREIRAYLKAHPRFGGQVVNCMGMRAQESSGRAKLAAVKVSDRNSKAGRTWVDWLPIHDLTERQVFAVIALAGQRPHWVYAAGMSRYSCCFCIMSSDADLTTAARIAPPAIYANLVAREIRDGFTLSMSRRPLEEITGVKADLTLADFMPAGGCAGRA